MTDYHPISCDLHSQYELWAMHRSELKIRLSGESDPLIGIIADIVTRKRVEYLVVESGDADPREIRLDSIEGVEELDRS